MCCTIIRAKRLRPFVTGVGSPSLPHPLKIHFEISRLSCFTWETVVKFHGKFSLKISTQTFILNVCHLAPANLAALWVLDHKIFKCILLRKEMNCFQIIRVGYLNLGSQVKKERSMNQGYYVGGSFDARSKDVGPFPTVDGLGYILLTWTFST